MEQSGRRIEICGTVQGVGYRPFVYQVARRCGVRGSVRNDSRGVVIDAFAGVEALERFLHELEVAAPPAARVRTIEWSAIPYRSASQFTIGSSADSAERRVSIPADLATCDDCLREILDPTDRRYRYPFTNCTNCGPRYSIVTGSPYDRSMTSMARFAMCQPCRREYNDPANRRFHAQPNACPDCGPRLQAMNGRQQEIATSDPINFAGRALRAGLIVAIKGIGGFHLACDATSPTAVRRLRERKRREAKPLAVMVGDLAAAEVIAELSDDDRALLTSIERPIVLVPLRRESSLTPEVSDHIALAGLFLPYTPLHHLLMREANRPLVMTSGNASDEPMVTANDQAFACLAEIADIFLIHNRDIVARTDDSVARIIGGGPVILRRGRGYVPRGIESARAFPEPVLACGAHLKNTFCIGSGNAAFLGPHIGDLETVDTLRDYETAIDRMKTFVGADPKVVAHDLHPDYLSTRYALALSGVRTIGVQHHHAHIATAMAEHALEGPVIGIAYDGTGFGTDGTSWGGEILLARYEGFERFATFRPITLPGGDQAIRHPWRAALALLDDAFDGRPPLHRIPLFRSIDHQVVDATRRATAARLNAPLARGVGRQFDAVAAFVLGLPSARYEGELALRWNLAADPSERGRYPIVVHHAATPWEIDPRPMVRAAVADLLDGRTAATISARFHNSIAAATVEIARAALAQHGEMAVVLSGGCFQNARLAESIIEPLRNDAAVFMNRAIPPGDGGIALGQAFVAAAVLRAGSPVRQEELVCV